MDFKTDNPLDEERVRVSATIGDHEAQRFYGRYDTGLFLNDTTKAWISISTQSATDWIEGSAENERDHFAAKIMSAVAGVDLIGYVSFDDTHEDNYQRVYSAADFAAYPEWDQLTGEWTGISYIDQSYRRAWSTLRENFFAYLKAEKAFDNGLTLNGAVYRHDNGGRGDWVPPGLQTFVTMQAVRKRNTRARRRSSAIATLVLRAHSSLLTLQAMPWRRPVVACLP